VALGGALLESGAAREALQQFDRYLASSGNKSLAAEALYGRARAMGALHNRTEERAAWLRLTQEFPRSPYSATATRRLQSLE
jgi:TolA-binding protein